MKKLVLLSSGLVLISFLFLVSAEGAPISFIFEGNASGSIGTNTFSNAEFIFTAYADTDHVEMWSAVSQVGPFPGEHNGQHTQNLLAFINIEGIGLYEFIADTISLVNNTYGWVSIGVGNIDGDPFPPYAFLGSPISSALADWEMKTSMDPIEGTEPLFYFGTIDTSGGALAFDVQSGSVTVFEAHVVPIPSAILLLFSGLAGIVVGGHIKRKIILFGPRRATRDVPIDPRFDSTIAHF